MDGNGLVVFGIVCLAGAAWMCATRNTVKPDEKVGGTSFDAGNWTPQKMTGVAVFLTLFGVMSIAAGVLSLLGYAD